MKQEALTYRPMIFTPKNYQCEVLADGRPQMLTQGVATRSGRPPRFVVHAHAGSIAGNTLLYAAYLAEAYDAAEVNLQVVGRERDAVPTVRQVREQHARRRPDKRTEDALLGAFDQIEIRGESVSKRQRLIIGQAACELYESLHL